VPFTKSADAVAKFRLGYKVAAGAIQAFTDTMPTPRANLVAIDLPIPRQVPARPTASPLGFVDPTVGEFL
jgi:hypothetical protein